MVFCKTPAVPEVEPIEEEAPNEVQFNVEDLQIIEAIWRTINFWSTDNCWRIFGFET